MTADSEDCAGLVGVLRVFGADAAPVIGAPELITDLVVFDGDWPLFIIRQSLYTIHNPLFIIRC